MGRGCVLFLHSFIQQIRIKLQLYVDLCSRAGVDLWGSHSVVKQKGSKECVCVSLQVCMKTPSLRLRCEGCRRSPRLKAWLVLSFRFSRTSDFKSR